MVDTNDLNEDSSKMYIEISSASVCGHYHDNTEPDCHFYEKNPCGKNECKFRYATKCKNTDAHRWAIEHDNIKSRKTFGWVNVLLRGTIRLSEIIKNYKEGEW